MLPGAAGRHTATVRAAEPTVLMRLERETFRRLVAEEGPAYRHVLELGDRHRREQLARRSRLVGSLGVDFDAAEGTIAAGAVLFREGEEAESVYLILSGTAAAYRDGVLLARVHAGRCVGELAFVRRSRRSATVVAETELRVLEVDGRRFVELLESSPELSAQMRALERVYRLPARGVVTQHTGLLLGEEAITTLYHLDDGRQFAASRIVAGDLYHLERVVPRHDAERATVLRHRDAELVVLPDGTIVAITAGGDWPDLAGAHLLAIDGVALTPQQRETFTRAGTLEVAAAVQAADLTAVLCTCVHVTRDAVDAAIRAGSATPVALQQTLSCGTVCGACLPRLSVRLGEAAWAPVEVVAELRLTPTVRAFRLRPPSGATAPWQPGQHVVVSAHSHGRWVERAYTVTGRPGDDAYEITVKREPQGLFSRWLFDVRTDADRLRVSNPQGDVPWANPGATMLCFVAGIGVAPALATCRATGTAACHIDYSGRRLAELAYVEELRATPGVSLVVRETATEGRLSAPAVRSSSRIRPRTRSSAGRRDICSTWPPTCVRPACRRTESTSRSSRTRAGRCRLHPSDPSGCRAPGAEPSESRGDPAPRDRTNRVAPAGG